MIEDKTYITPKSSMPEIVITPSGQSPEEQAIEQAYQNRFKNARLPIPVDNTAALQSKMNKAVAERNGLGRQFAPYFLGVFNPLAFTASMIGGHTVDEVSSAAYNATHDDKANGFGQALVRSTVGKGHPIAETVAGFFNPGYLLGGSTLKGADKSMRMFHTNLSKKAIQEEAARMMTQNMKKPVIQSETIFPGLVGWAPKQTFKGYHASNEQVFKPSSVFLAERPYAVEKPMIHIGEVSTKNGVRVSDFNENYYRSIYDKELSHHSIPKPLKGNPDYFVKTTNSPYQAVQEYMKGEDDIRSLLPESEAKNFLLDWLQFYKKQNTSYQHPKKAINGVTPSDGKSVNAFLQQVGNELPTSQDYVDFITALQRDYPKQNITLQSVHPESIKDYLHTLQASFPQYKIKVTSDLNPSLKFIPIKKTRKKLSRNLFKTVDPNKAEDVLQQRMLTEGTTQPYEEISFEELSKLFKQKYGDNVNFLLENTKYNATGIDGKVYISKAFPEHLRSIIKAHEAEHAMHIPETYPKGVLQFGASDYFGQLNGTEQAARAGQMLNILGITNRAKTPFTAKHVQWFKDNPDVMPINNDWQDFLNSIINNKAFAEWVNNPKNVKNVAIPITVGGALTQD